MTQQFGRLWSEADIQRTALTNPNLRVHAVEPGIAGVAALLTLFDSIGLRGPPIGQLLPQMLRPGRRCCTEYPRKLFPCGQRGYSALIADPRGSYAAFHRKLGTYTAD